MAKSKIRFPWFAYIATIACVLYFLTINNTFWREYLDIPSAYLQPRIQLAIVIFLFLILILEIGRFQHNKNRFDRQIVKYEAQLAELFQSKNKLQNKVHKYSDHADKLKVFISDRLLEYIEYDEKFLHFKNIASEVRHNGVISYDKVNTALRAAIEQNTDGDTSRYQDAIDSMIYLWDLLDLSTTDNIAMYIANKLYESEELYYRQQLEENKEQPFSPVFSARHAIIKTLKSFVKDMGGELREEDTAEALYAFNNAKFSIYLEDTGQLLGNENYIILMLENLVNNALYYINNKKYGNKYSRIAIELVRKQGNAVLTVFNNGPLIDDSVKDQIFQLGFSTKRTKGNNGKGLGLYFVNEIVKGYEGKLAVENVRNVTDTYVVRVELADGSKFHEIITTELNEQQKPICHINRDKAVLDEVQFKFKDNVKNIELSVQSSQKTHTVHDFDSKGSTVFLDPEHRANPRWSLEFTSLKTQNRLTFRPLDSTGVRFIIRIPTAESRLDPDFHEVPSEELARLEKIDIELDDIDDYIN